MTEQTGERFDGEMENKKRKAKKTLTFFFYKFQNKHWRIENGEPTRVFTV